MSQPPNRGRGNRGRGNIFVGYNRAAEAAAQEAAEAAAQAEAETTAQAADIIRRRGNRGRGGIIMNIEDRRGRIARAERMLEEAARAAEQEEAARAAAAAAQEEAALLAPERTEQDRVREHMAFMDSMNARRPRRQMGPRDYFKVKPTARNFPEDHDYYPGLTHEQIMTSTRRIHMGGEKKRKYTSVLRKKYQQRRRRRSSTKKYKNKKN